MRLKCLKFLICLAVAGCRRNSCGEGSNVLYYIVDGVRKKGERR